jgi:hypothetical protein
VNSNDVNGVNSNDVNGVNYFKVESYDGSVDELENEDGI